MARITWSRGPINPMQELERLQDEINNLFDVPTRATTRGLFDRTVSPPLDMGETEDAYVIHCDLPGVAQDDLELTVASGVLTLKGEKKLPERPQGSRMYREETWSGRFQRTLSLPGEVDPDKVTATQTNGVLVITLPKREESMPKQITVGVE
mgnify:CR=1 FL=1